MEPEECLDVLGGVVDVPVVVDDQDEPAQSLEGDRLEVRLLNVLVYSHLRWPLPSGRGDSARCGGRGWSAPRERARCAAERCTGGWAGGRGPRS